MFDEGFVGIKKRILSPTKRDIFFALLIFIAAPLLIVFLAHIPFLQNILINTASSVLGKTLDAEHWHSYMNEISVLFFFEMAAAFVILTLIHYFLLDDDKNFLVLPEKIKNALPKNLATYLVWAFFILTSAISFITVLNHEPWGDEMIAWKFAREKSIPELFTLMRYEGHFLPWYMLLMPFAKTGCSELWLCLVSWTINTIANFIFVKKAPLNALAKIIVLFTTPFLFWNPVVARPYVLISLIFFLIGSLYEKRNENPIWFAICIAFLANTHAYIEGVVGILSLFFFIEDIIIPWKNYSSRQKKLHLAALAIILGGVLFALAQVAPAFIYSPLLVSEASHAPGFESFNYFFTSSGFTTAPQKYTFIALIMATFLYLACTSIKGFFLLFASYLYMGLFCILIYNASIPNRALLWFVILIFSLWLSSGVSIRKKSIIIIVFSALLISPQLTIYDIKEPFGSPRNTTEYIKKNYPEGTKVFLSINTEVDLYYPDTHSYTELPDYVASCAGTDSQTVLFVSLDKDIFYKDTLIAVSKNASIKFVKKIKGVVWADLNIYEISPNSTK